MCKLLILANANVHETDKCDEPISHAYTIPRAMRATLLLATDESPQFPISRNTNSIYQISGRDCISTQRGRT